MTNRTFSIVGAAMLLVLFALAQQLDPHDFDSEAVKERREWMAQARACQTKYGGLQSSAEYDERGQLVCVTRRGEVLQ